MVDTGRAGAAGTAFLQALNGDLNSILADTKEHSKKHAASLRLAVAAERESREVAIAGLAARLEEEARLRAALERRQAEFEAQVKTWFSELATSSPASPSPAALSRGSAAAVAAAAKEEGALLVEAAETATVEDEEEDDNTAKYGRSTSAAFYDSAADESGSASSSAGARSAANSADLRSVVSDAARGQEVTHSLKLPLADVQHQFKQPPAEVLPQGPRTKPIPPMLPAFKEPPPKAAVAPPGSATAVPCKSPPPGPATKRPPPEPWAAPVAGAAASVHNVEPPLAVLAAPAGYKATPLPLPPPWKPTPPVAPSAKAGASWGCGLVPPSIPGPFAEPLVKAIPPGLPAAGPLVSTGPTLSAAPPPGPVTKKPPPPLPAGVAKLGPPGVPFAKKAPPVLPTDR